MICFNFKAAFTHTRHLLHFSIYDCDSFTLGRSVLRRSGHHQRRAGLEIELPTHRGWNPRYLHESLNYKIV